jgi:hypothetical protein
MRGEDTTERRSVVQQVVEGGRGRERSEALAEGR